MTGRNGSRTWSYPRKTERGSRITRGREAKLWWRVRDTQRDVKGRCKFETRGPVCCTLFNLAFQRHTIGADVSREEWIDLQASLPSLVILRPVSISIWSAETCIRVQKDVRRTSDRHGDSGERLLASSLHLHSSCVILLLDYKCLHLKVKFSQGKEKGPSSDSRLYIFYFTGHWSDKA